MTTAQKTSHTLDFDKILITLSEFALCQSTKDKLLSLTPTVSERDCRLKMLETTNGRTIIETFGNPPLASMRDLSKNLELAIKGSMLSPEQLTGVAYFIQSCRQMKLYLKKAQILDLEIAFYGNSFDTLDYLYEEIDRSIRNDSVDDTASPILRDIRRRIENAKSSIKSKLESILSSKKSWFAEGYVATRNGRFVLPVKKEYKNQVNGSVIDKSGTGSTLFIEPTIVRKLSEELSSLEIDEDNEIRRILYTLTALVDEHVTAIKTNIDCMETLDFIFAKAKLSISMQGISVPITTNRDINIINGKHPLLNKDTCVPLNFHLGKAFLGKDFSGIVITGPNTGGKTVALKTVGLLSLMVLCGLHVPVDSGSSFCMHSNILCDIGDGQSITENLSTFSSHITNIIDILKNTTNESLVLLDELGSGTDPAEGMGIAISILDELKSKGCMFVATTHYPEIKDFARDTSGLTNARMDFDRESLKPLYSLQIGEAGESCALYIAKRLGFPDHMLNRAAKAAYSDDHAKNKTSSKDLGSLSTPMEYNGEIPFPIAITGSKIIKEKTIKSDLSRSERFNIGDSVTVYPQKAVGIVFKQSNDKGEIGVQIKGKKQIINHKRIKLLTPASELYPDDYDFSIIFDSVSVRKAHRSMDKKHDPDLIINYDE